MQTQKYHNGSAYGREKGQGRHGKRQKNHCYHSVYIVFEEGFIN
jgi:hypothetical protein